MCEYCECDKILMQEEIDVLRGIGKIGEGGYVDKDVLYVMYDSRGYLRLVNEDYGCLDHGERIKMNYCFNCGRKL